MYIYVYTTPNPALLLCEYYAHMSCMLHVSVVHIPTNLSVKHVYGMRIIIQLSFFGEVTSLTTTPGKNIFMC